jgi:type II secretory ATPase GspE/PulE/Tfp pilus assembly ATPase PilB-like protein
VTKDIGERGCADRRKDSVDGYCLWSPCHLVTLSPCHLVIGAVLERGPGYYFHPLKLFVAVSLYLVWVRTCWWVDQDLQEVDLRSDVWNGVVFSAGVLGLLSLWLLPFLFGFLLFAAMVGGAVLAYIGVRNPLVRPEKRLLTGEHLGDWLQRLFSRKGTRGGGEQAETTRHVPLQFVGKSEGGRGDPERVSHAQESPGYQAALELVQEALEKDATDIHLEPSREEFGVRLRIDGVLQPRDPLPRETGEQVVNIFKVLADLDITDRRKPQDGSFSAIWRPEAPQKRGGQVRNLGGHPPNPPATRMLDCRVATAGGVAGEKMVMRILERTSRITSLAEIGMRERLREQVKSLIARPHGMFLVCGPTGVGKSTTLHVCLLQIDRFQKNVITLENPVEYRIENATQIEVNLKVGKTFASELRSILRQDPDVIYVGEVRDAETAEVACQAAQTGHLVFTTLHANDTVTAILRLLDLRVAPHLVANALTGILGQRLVRLLCPKCKEQYRPNPEILRRANLPLDKITHFYRARESAPDARKPCPHCGGTGYKGRTAIFEFLLVNDAIRALIKPDPDVEAIRREAVRTGMTHLQEDGLRLVIEGRTSIQEIVRVCT